jgi:hypothetical protein
MSEHSEGLLSRKQASVRLGQGPSWVKTGKPQREQMFSALLLRADIAQQSRHVRFVPILLQKSFWGVERKFLEPLMRFTRGDVRDHIVSSKVDHGSP